jgi:hypothetical protein
VVTTHTLDRDPVFADVVGDPALMLIHVCGGGYLAQVPRSLMD